MANNREAELSMESAQAALVSVLGTFGEGWALDPAAPSVHPDEIKRVREEIAVPVMNGAFMGLAYALWKTAPPGSTPAMLESHLRLLLPAMVAFATADEPAGEFWRHCAESIETAMGRRH